MNSWLQDNDKEVYSTHNERKSVVTKTFFTSLKNKIYKYIISETKKVFIDKLANIINKCNNTYTDIKMKPVDEKSRRSFL